MFRKLTLHHFILGTVWLLAVALRCQNFFLLPIDAHAMRQTDTESVAYYFAHKDPNPLHPQASLIRPQTNIHGYFFLEFPAYEYLLSLAYRVFGSSIVVARIFNLFLFSISYCLIYLFARQFLHKEIALWSSVVYTLIPSSIFFFGHAIHPDLFAMTTTLGALYLVSTQKRNLIRTVCSGILFAMAVGTRPFLLMALPSLLVVTYFKKGKWWEFVLLSIASVSIYGFWSWWQTFFPEADHSWQYWTLQGREALYTFSGWKHLIWRNTSGEVIGRVTSGLAFLGLVLILVRIIQFALSPSIQLKLRKLLQMVWRKPNTLSIAFKVLIFCFPWLAAVPVYWYIAPAGNAAHQYYANVFVLPIIILAAYAVHSIISYIQNAPTQFALGCVIFLLLLANGFRTSSYFYKDIARPEYLEIAKVIAEHVPENEKIVYLATNNSVPFSLAHRQGWMLGSEPTDVASTAEAVLNMRKFGARYFVHARQNNDLSDQEVEKLKEQTVAIYSSDQIKIYTLKETQK